MYKLLQEPSGEAPDPKLSSDLDSLSPSRESIHGPLTHITYGVFYPPSLDTSSPGILKVTKPAPFLETHLQPAQLSALGTNATSVSSSGVSGPNPWLNVQRGRSAVSVSGDTTPHPA